MTTLTYLFDPLCGWCYAAAPAIRLLAEQADFRIRALPTGLFAQPGRVMDADFAAHAWHNDQRIAALTGQVFSEQYREQLLQAASSFDSTHITDALTAVAQSHPTQELAALAAIQTARYVDGRDNTSPAVLADILQTLGLHEAAARITHSDTRATAQTRINEGRALMNKLGLQGVPQLLLHPADGSSPQAVSGNLLFDDVAQLPLRLRQGV